MSTTTATATSKTYIPQETRLACTCGYAWIENREIYYGCPKCEDNNNNNRNLIQSASSSKNKRNVPRSVLDDMEMLLNFAMGDDRHQWYEMDK